MDKNRYVDRMVDESPAEDVDYYLRDATTPEARRYERTEDHWPGYAVKPQSSRSAGAFQTARAARKYWIILGATLTLGLLFAFGLLDAGGVLGGHADLAHACVGDEGAGRAAENGIRDKGHWVPLFLLLTHPQHDRAMVTRQALRCTSHRPLSMASPHR